MTNNSENSGRHQGQFKPGQSGNPAGKPKATRNKATLAVETLLDGEAEELTRKAIELAIPALRICLDRILPPRKDQGLCRLTFSGSTVLGMYPKRFPRSWLP
jgi:hypothetical protein